MDGYPVRIVLAEQFFCDNDTVSKLAVAAGSGVAAATLHSGATVCGLRLQESGGMTKCTLVSEIAWADKPDPRATIQGNAIVIEDYGTVYFGEMYVTCYSRRITMVRFELGSPDGGDGCSGRRKRQRRPLAPELPVNALACGGFAGPGRLFPAYAPSGWTGCMTLPMPISGRARWPKFNRKPNTASNSPARAATRSSNGVSVSWPGTLALRPKIRSRARGIEPSMPETPGFGALVARRLLLQSRAAAGLGEADESRRLWERARQMAEGAHAKDVLVEIEAIQGRRLIDRPPVR